MNKMGNIAFAGDSGRKFGYVEKFSEKVLFGRFFQQTKRVWMKNGANSLLGLRGKSKKMQAIINDAVCLPF